jgi:two-component system, sensor histidine kinase
MRLGPENTIDVPVSVLVAEDDEGLLHLALKYLRRAGMSAEGVTSGADVLARMAEDPPALLLLDYNLTDMTAEQVVEALREQESVVPFIVITGDGDARLAVEMMKLGARDYLMKDGALLGFLPVVVDRTLKQLEVERKREVAEEALRTVVEVTLGTTGEESFDRIADELCRWVGLDAVIIGELTDGGMVQTAAVKMDGNAVQNFTYELLGTPCANVKEMGACLYQQKICELFPKDTMLVDMGMEGYIGTPLRNKCGEVVGILCGLSRQPISEPPTWREIMSLLGAKAVGELERRGAEKAILRAKEQAEAANNAKGEFLANMSHEVRTPLNGVLGMLQILQKSQLNEEQRECLEVALNSGRSLIRIIGDILDLSKIESGKMDIKEERVEIEEIIHSIQDTFINEAKLKDIAVQCRIDSALPVFVKGDSGRLRQILFNLVGNAVKFTKQGQVGIRAFHENMGTNSDCFDLCFEVFDTGIGIPEDKINVIFEPFTQVDGSYTRKYGGTGLGMSIVKRLVDLMGGVVRIESRMGVGTTVGFRIPVKSLPGGRARQETRQHAASCAYKLNILLAEDDLSNQLVVKRMLEKQGHTTACVGTGKDVLDVLEREVFDLVLMDVQMPEMDGTEATIEIRKDERFNTLPIIALTAHAMAGDRERFMKLGMDDYLAKPIDMEELTQVLSRVGVK